MGAKVLQTEDGKTFYGYTLLEVKSALNEALIESYEADEDISGMFDRILKKLNLKEENNGNIYK